MATSYAVKWREPDGQTFLGKLEFVSSNVVLEGRNGTADAVRRSFAFDELRAFHLARKPEERLDDQPTLVVGRAGGNVLVTSTVVHAGVLQELVHRLAELRLLALREPSPLS